MMKPTKWKREIARGRTRDREIEEKDMGSDDRLHGFFQLADHIFVDIRRHMGCLLTYIR